MLGKNLQIRKSAVPRIGERSYGRDMILKDKLQMLMNRHRLNGQKLARQAQVSDSEISRILQGKSRPGLDNAFRLAKAVGVSLDYLADDSLDIDTTSQPADNLSTEERRILTIAQRLGCSEVLTILETIRFLGYDLAMTRLVGAKPIIEIDKDLVPEVRAPVAAVVATVTAPARANSATA
jgi:transcriptional regulator with XRE-family HTH domain